MTRATIRSTINAKVSATAAVTCALAGAAALLGSGCEKGYDISIEVNDAVSAACNTGCVQSVLVYAFGDEDESVKCYPATMPNLRQHGMDGKIDLPVPPGFSGVWVSMWGEADCLGAPVAEGFASQDSETIKVNLVCTASCAARGPLNVRVTNVLDVVKGQCDGTTPKPNRVAAGVLRLFELSTLFEGAPSYAEFYPVAAVNTSIAVDAMVQGLSSAGQAGCAAAAVYRDGTPTNVACLRAGALGGACAPAGTTEVAYYPGTPIADTANGFRSIGVFARRNTVTPTAPQPIAGAVVSVPASVMATTRIEYLDLVGDALQPNAALRATSTTGAFAVTSIKPVTVTVTMGGERSTRLMGGGDVFTGPDTPPIATMGAQIFLPD